MKIRGVKKGKNIELFDEINIPDGTEVIIDIQEVSIIIKKEEEKLRKIKEFLSKDWEGKEDFVRTMEELEKEKNAEWERLYGLYS